MSFDHITLWDDGTDPENAVPDGCGTGLITRDFGSAPQGYCASAPAFPDSELIPESEWADRLVQIRKDKSGLLDLREANYDLLKSLNQTNHSLCWAFSTTKAVMYIRALMNLPGVVLSGWYTAGKVKGWRDQGGNGIDSLEQAVEGGIASLEACPQYSRQYDNATVDANAALHKVVSWFDGSSNPRTAQKQAVSCLLRGWPCVVDLDALGHSMACIDIASLNPLTFVYDNSWGTAADPLGLYRGSGAYAMPNGLVMPRVTLVS